ncbi:MarR family transcriptional regulator [Burkholderia cenocepacia]
MSKTHRAENLLGVLALLIGDEMNRLDVAAAPSGQTARAMLNAIAQYPNASIELIRDAVALSHPAAVRAIAALVEAGLVDKRPGADKRAVSLALTPATRRCSACATRASRCCRASRAGSTRTSGRRSSSC